MIKRFRKILWIAMAVFLLVELLAYLFQHQLIFQGTRLAENYSYKFSHPYHFTEYFLKTHDNQLLNVLWFSPEKKSRGIIIYFHGNANNLQRWGEYASDFVSLGYEIVMMDYRGYGKSTGKANEENLYQDALQFFNWVKEKSGVEVKIIYGRSLGSAIASHLAADVQPDLLILETPFDELGNARMARIFYFLVPPSYSFRTKDFFKHVKGKKVIIHGTNDWVVPLQAAEGLKPYLSEHDEFVVIDKGGHRNLREFPGYHQTLKRILQ